MDIHIINHENMAMKFGTNGSEKMRIDSSGRLLVGTSNSSNGHVSASNLAVQGADIGTSNPVQQAGRGLHINGTDQTRIKLTNSTSGATANDGFDIIQESDMDIHIINHENMAMKFGTNGSEKMRIDSSGRLLVGTSNSSNGHVSASNLAVQGADIAIFKDSGGDNSGVSGHKLKFVTQSGSLGEIDVLSEGGGGPRS